jgi:hypothetical protein
VAADDEVTIAIRPEHLKIDVPGEAPSGHNTFRGTVGNQSFVGNLLNVKVQVHADRGMPAGPGVA